MWQGLEIKNERTPTCKEHTDAESETGSGEAGIQGVRETGRYRWSDRKDGTERSWRWSDRRSVTGVIAIRLVIHLVIVIQKVIQRVIVSARVMVPKR